MRELKPQASTQRSFTGPTPGISRASKAKLGWRSHYISTISKRKGLHQESTRLESVILGFITSKDDLRRLKQNLVRSNTRSVYKSDTDDRLVEHHHEIQRIAGAIEARRIELGKTSGFERLYARVTKLYFGGMLRHLLDLRPILRPGAQLAYVVGNQASYLRVMIRTGQLLGDLAKTAGYNVVDIDLLRPAGNRDKISTSRGSCRFALARASYRKRLASGIAGERHEPQRRTV